MNPTSRATLVRFILPRARHVCTLLLFFIAVARVAEAQDAPYSQEFIRFSSEDGLANNTILSIAQDARGFLWFGTDDGASQFDGKSFKTYHLKNTDETETPSQAFLQLLASKSGKVFFRTSRHAGFCVSSSLSLTVISEWSSPDYIALFEQGGKEFLYLVRSDSLFKLELSASGEHLVLDSLRLNSTTPSRPIYVSDKRGNFWLIESGEIKQASWATRRVETKTVLPPNAPSVYTAMMDDEENLWIGGWIQDKSQNLLVMPTKGARAFQAQSPFDALRDSPAKTALISDGINFLEQSPSGNIWIGSRRNGAFRLSPPFGQAQRALTHFVYDPNDPLGLSGSRVTAVFEERNGGIWFGFESFGLNQLPVLHKPFFLLRHYPLKSNSLSNNYIRSIYRSHTGDLWICTQFGGLNRVQFNHDLTQPKITRYNQSGKRLNCWAIAERRDGKLIAGFNGSEIGLFLIDPNADTSDVQFKKIHTLTRTQVIKAIGDDRFLIGGEGLWLLDDNRLNPFGTQTAETLGLINDVLLARDQTCWVAADDGLFRFDLNGRLLQRITTYRDENDTQKPVRFLSCILERESGEIWIASKGGGIFKLESGTLHAFSSSEKSAHNPLRLPSQRCYGILEDDARRMWVSCDAGLISFAPDDSKQNYALRHYQQSDGLQGLEFNRRAFFKDGDGLMYFGGTNGLNYFNPKHIGLDTLPFRVAVRSMKLFNEELDAAPDALMEFNHTQNFLSFTLSEFSFNPRATVSFRYRLNESAWQESSGNVISFVSLEPGEYELVVKGMNRDGVESVNSESRRFRIRPPFYKTTWAFAIYGAAIVAGVFAFIHFRTRRMRRENLRLEELVEARTRDLAEANRFKTRLMEIAAHDLRNPLQSIFGFAKLIGEADDLHDSKRFAEHIEKSSKQMVNLVEDLLERKSEGDWQLSLQPHDVGAVVLEAVEKWTGAARAKAQSLSFAPLSSGEKLTVSFDERRIRQVLDNLIGNAIKYTHNGGAIRVSISKSHAHCFVRIEDDGQGLSEADKERLFQTGARLSATPTGGEASHGIGLSIAKELMLRHGGKIWAESDGKGKGAAFMISLPLK
ncbi:MAG: two-component regulator propeller domain-containing protein [Chloroherpetonaceae bacterium]